MQYSTARKPLNNERRAKATELIFVPEKRKPTAYSREMAVGVFSLYPFALWTIR